MAAVAPLSRVSRPRTRAVGLILIILVLGSHGIEARNKIEHALQLQLHSTAGRTGVTVSASSGAKGGIARRRAARGNAVAVRARAKARISNLAFAGEMALETTKLGIGVTGIVIGVTALVGGAAFPPLGLALVAVASIAIVAYELKEFIDKRRAIVSMRGGWLSGLWLASASFVG